MPRKTIIIFITTFILVGIIVLGVYFWLNRNSVTPPDEVSPWYKKFNPFGVSNNPNNINPNNDNPVVEPSQPQEEPLITKTSRFYKITDFAVAGASFSEETKLVKNTESSNTTQQEQVKVNILPNTKEGRKEIQTILNNTLSLKPPLVVDGVFGKKATEAIKSFQKLNNLTVTGVIDDETSPFFTKIITGPTLPKENVYEKIPSVSYVEKMNGHLYKMNLSNKTKEKISNSTIPNIYEAFFDKTANTVIYRYLSTDKIISTFLATLGSSSGEFLPLDVYNLSVSRNKTKFFYLTKNNDGSTGTLREFGEKEKKVVFNSPFTEWLTEWDSNDRVFLTTKPSYNFKGSMFMLDATNKTILKVLGGVDGLTTLINPKGSVVLYGSSTYTGPKLEVFDIGMHETKELDAYGLPEKCVWSNDNINIYCAIPNVVVGNEYPDYWYQGLISFDDYFVKINTVTGDKITLANSVDETPVDGISLFLDANETTLFFINKKDYTFWSLDIQ